MNQGENALRALIGSYSRALYRIVLPQVEIEIAPGQRATRLETRLPAQCYTVITAFNPGSRPRSQEENHLANQSLYLHLEASATALFPSVASDSGGHWLEPGWLAAGLDRASTDGLARRFGQTGILHWDFSQPVRLRLYLPPVPSLCCPWLDWAGQD